MAQNSNDRPTATATMLTWM